MLEYFMIYLSLFLGKILHFLTEEEIKQWKKYLILSKNILLVLVIISFLKFDYLILSLIPSYFLFKYLKVNYFLFGLGSILSIYSKSIILSLSLLFILALLHSSMEQFKVKKFIVSSAWFILPFGLLFIETFINANSGIFTGVLIGGLVAQLGRATES